MSAMAAHHLDDPIPDPDVAAARIEIVRGLGDVEAAWRAFEHRAVMAPYGRFDWVAAYQRNLPDAGRGTHVALRRDAAGEVDILMPFQLDRHLGLTVATTIGGKHSNYNLPLQRPDVAASLGEDEARRFLQLAGKAMGADLMVAINTPVAWEGHPNPFAAGGLPGSSPAYSLRLDGDSETILGRSMSREARKKARTKARDLAKLGPVRTLRARNEEEVDLLLDAFLDQKARRLGQRGIDDPYGTPRLRCFLRDAATSSLTDGRPAIELHGLLLGEDVIAILGGASDGRRFGGLIVSFEEEMARYSPGEMLIVEAIKDLCARGFETFDLGIGEARYKRSICDEREALVDLVIPVTLPGRAYALAHVGILGAKRRIKADARAMALVEKVRRLKVGLLG